MNPFLLSALLLLLAAGLLLAASVSTFIQRRALLYRMGSERGRRPRTLANLGRETMGRWRWSLDPEVTQLLNQLGWRKPGKRAAFFAVQLGLPLVAVLVAVFLFALGNSDGLMFVLILVAGIAFLLPKRWLVRAVKQRGERLGIEVSTMIPLLRMLFDVGMTVEQALRALVDDGGRIFPELSSELSWVLARVDAGLDLGAELQQMAVVLDVDEVTDCVTILEQLLRQGGGAMASLLSLKQLLDDRRMTALQEKVSKMSAKMSVVMVAFLFPALLIVLGGPGFIAIFQALGGFGE